MHRTHEAYQSHELYMAIHKLFADWSTKIPLHMSHGADMSHEPWVMHYIYVVRVLHTNYIRVTNSI